MADIYHLDYESFSEEDIDNGHFKYSAHPSTEILIFAIARNDEPVEVWSVLGHNPDALMLLAEAVESGAEIWAHNAQFEFAISKNLFRRTFNLAPPANEQWHCTATLCRLAAIPSSLAGAGEFLGIDNGKDSDGKRLITKFSIPHKPSKKDARTRIMPADEPEDFQRFADYCKRDVEAEREIHKLLTKFQQPVPGQKCYQADLRMNDRGIPVNIQALKHADSLVREYSERLIPIFQQQTSCPGETVTLPITKQRTKAPKVVPLDEGFNPSQNELMKHWLAERGFTGSDLTADTVESWLALPLSERLTPQALTALKTYSLIGSAAIKKIPAMLAMAEVDGYVRGALLIYGAERSHRWTGKGIQPQNYARPVIEFTELAYSCICNGATIDELESLFGDLYPILISVIRHFIQPHDGRKVLQADYSAIEARIAPWLVGEEKTLNLFRAKAKLYEIMASLIFGVPPDVVSKDQRFIGKQAVLGCSYNMGRPKFRATCESYGFSPSEQMVEDYKPRHDAFVGKAVAKAKAEIRRNFEEKNGMATPAKFLSEDYISRKVCRDNGWTTLKPETFAEWKHFTFDDLADRAVTKWREENPMIVASWRKLDDAAKAAINDPGSLHTVGKLTLGVLDFPKFAALCMRLPSGHYLIYPRPSVVANDSHGWGTQVRFWGVMPNTGGQWGWCHTYGGKLLENATQATAGDVMREGMLAAEAEGYEPFMLVHDEMLATRKEGQTHERLCELLCTMPAWADGLPLEAEGSTIPFYKK